MRRLLILLALILSGASVLLAQKTEISIALNFGLSYFGGKNAQKETF